jgi:hypothetical protein
MGGEVRSWCCTAAQLDALEAKEPLGLGCDAAVGGRSVEQHTCSLGQGSGSGSGLGLGCMSSTAAAHLQCSARR